MKLALFMGVIVISTVSVNAHAFKVDMKPGLWEYTMKFDQESMVAMTGLQKDQMSKAMEDMKKQMASMPPEQRKMMEDMMAKQGIKVSDQGIEMASQGFAISKEGTKVKACVTQAEIDRGEMPQADEDCEQKITQSSTSHIKVNFVCKGEPPMHGEGEVTFQNDKSYSGTLRMVTKINGKEQTIKGDQAGRWLSADCGNIKPATPN